MHTELTFIGGWWSLRHDAKYCRQIISFDPDRNLGVGGGSGGGKSSFYKMSIMDVSFLDPGHEKPKWENSDSIHFPTVAPVAASQRGVLPDDSTTPGVLPPRHSSIHL